MSPRLRFFIAGGAKEIGSGRWMQPEKRSASRNGKVKSCAFVWLPFGPGAAPVARDNTPDVCEADAGPFEVGSAMEPLENAEKFVGVAWIEANAVIADEKDDFTV